MQVLTERLQSVERARRDEAVSDAVSVEGGWIKERTYWTEADWLVSLRVLEIVEIFGDLMGDMMRSDWLNATSSPTAITYWTFEGVCYGNLSPKLHPPTSTKKRGRNSKGDSSKSLCL